MSNYHYSKLNPEKALIWRIIHRDNLSWILDNGLHCGNSDSHYLQWVSIGNQELIDKRATHPVPCHPNGVLNDYVPFYFTPFSIMLKNIHTGWGGVTKQRNEDIVILVSSLRQIQKQDLPFLFTDRHAYCQWTAFYNDLNDLDKIDWSLLQRRNFSRDPDDPAKIERYQAEALVYQHCPISALLGMICYTDDMKYQLEQLVEEHDAALKVVSRPQWYFS